MAAQYSALPLTITTPLLTISEQLAVQPGATITVPITFSANGHNVAAAIFSIDYDERWLTFDSTDGDNNTIPDAIHFHAPAPFTASVMVNAADHDGELDVVIADLAPPIATLPDGILVEIVFQVGQPVETTEAAVRFSTAPAVSFSAPTGQNIPLPTG
ncbi:MAG: cohesin domain-containing protein, partial [Caldilineaceae bacterium]